MLECLRVTALGRTGSSRSRDFQQTQVETADVQDRPDEQDTGHGRQDGVLRQAVLQLGTALPQPGSDRRAPVLPAPRVVTQERPLAARHLSAEMLDIFSHRHMELLNGPTGLVPIFVTD